MITHTMLSRAENPLFETPYLHNLKQKLQLFINKFNQWAFFSVEEKRKIKEWEQEVLSVYFPLFESGQQWEELAFALCDILNQILYPAMENPYFFDEEIDQLQLFETEMISILKLIVPKSEDINIFIEQYLQSTIKNENFDKKLKLMEAFFSQQQQNFLNAANAVNLELKQVNEECRNEGLTLNNERKEQFVAVQAKMQKNTDKIEDQQQELTQLIQKIELTHSTLQAQLELNQKTYKNIQKNVKL